MERNDEDVVLYDADEECEHEIEVQWSDIKCIKCGGWMAL